MNTNIYTDDTTIYFTMAFGITAINMKAMLVKYTHVLLSHSKCSSEKQ